MAQFDWHGKRAGPDGLPRHDRDPGTGAIDMAAVRAYRLARLRGEMRQRDVAICLPLEPVNIIHATGARNMQVFHKHNPARDLRVAQEGPVVLCEFIGCMHLATTPELQIIPCNAEAIHTRRSTEHLNMSAISQSRKMPV